MNKLTIPAILAATVLVAGIFAFMPVQQASTVHTTLGTAANVAIIDANVDLILVDTGTDIPATLTTAATAHGTAQTDLTLIVEDTGTDIPATLTTAATAHTNILSASLTIEVDTVTVTDFNTGDIVTLDCTTDYVVQSIVIDWVVADGGGGEVLDITIGGDDVFSYSSGVTSGGEVVLSFDIGGLAGEDLLLTGTDTVDGTDETMELRSTVLTENAGTCTLIQTTGA